MSAFRRTEFVHSALVHVSNARRQGATSLTTGYSGATELDHRSLGKVGRTESMPKILTARRREDERERARLYLKSRLMLPTIPLGMVTLLAGYGDIVLMWVQNQLTPQALLGSTILFLCGAVWGWGHARYERYLLGPANFAPRTSSGGGCLPRKENGLSPVTLSPAKGLPSPELLRVAQHDRMTPIGEPVGTSHRQNTGIVGWPSTRPAAGAPRCSDPGPRRPSGPTSTGTRPADYTRLP